MKVEAVIVSKDVPQWANGLIAWVGEKPVLLLRRKPKKVWPRWWHQLGMALRWRWLVRLGGLGSEFRSKAILPKALPAELKGEGK